ncbi:hypothetical protein SPONN_2655 [uncultured Candidatus Thioglobus sp.]|nr:hypothetical protein SPONN_2655 [uncultured Candidatus Thioglobus sp.]
MHPGCYENNPNFLKSELIKELEFKSHPDLKKQDIKDRTKLVQRICERLWSTDYFNSENA